MIILLPSFLKSFLTLDFAILYYDDYPTCLSLGIYDTSSCHHLVGKHEHFGL